MKQKSEPPELTLRTAQIEVWVCTQLHFNLNLLICQDLSRKEDKYVGALHKNICQLGANPCDIKCRTDLYLASDIRQNGKESVAEPKNQRQKYRRQMARYKRQPVRLFKQLNQLTTCSVCRAPEWILKRKANLM